MHFHKLLARLYYLALTQRYTVDLTGDELLRSPGAKLILPNHQSHIDSQLLAVITSQYGEYLPVVAERFLKIPVIGHVLRAWGAIAVSDLKGGNRDPDVLKKIFSQAIAAMEQGKSVIIYPSGQITHTPMEKIHNKQSAYEVVSNLPLGTRVIGVRISGLWGSMWSVAWSGERPDFVFTLLKGIFFVFANFIFFVPKRRIKIEFKDLTEEAVNRATSDRHSFNSYLEEFYNVYGPEEATYIRHLFYFPKSNRKYPQSLGMRHGHTIQFE